MAPFQRLEQPVIAHMAAILNRNVWLEQVVGSLVPQVDALYIYLNDYPFVPKTVSHPKLFFYHEPHGDLGAAAKFFKHQHGAINITVDDDLIYDGDFVARMIAGLKKHGGVVSLHGKYLRHRLQSYHRPRNELVGYHCLKPLKEDVRVHVPGTGAMAYDSEELGRIFTTHDFPTPNMADVWAAVFCKVHNIPVTVLSHRAGIVRQLPVFTSLFAQNFHRDEPHVKVLNEYFFPEAAAGQQPEQSRFSFGGPDGGLA